MAKKSKKAIEWRKKRGKRRKKKQRDYIPAKVSSASTIGGKQ